MTTTATETLLREARQHVESARRYVRAGEPGRAIAPLLAATQELELARICDVDGASGRSIELIRIAAGHVEQELRDAVSALEGRVAA